HDHQRLAAKDIETDAVEDSHGAAAGRRKANHDVPHRQYDVTIACVHAAHHIATQRRPQARLHAEFSHGSALSANVSMGIKELRNGRESFQSRCKMAWNALGRRRDTTLAPSSGSRTLDRFRNEWENAFDRLMRDPWGSVGSMLGREDWLTPRMDVSE